MHYNRTITSGFIGRPTLSNGNSGGKLRIQTLDRFARDEVDGVVGWRNTVDRMSIKLTYRIRGRFRGRFREFRGQFRRSM